MEHRFYIYAFLTTLFTLLHHTSSCLSFSWTHLVHATFPLYWEHLPPIPASPTGWFLDTLESKKKKKKEGEGEISIQTSMSFHQQLFLLQVADFASLALLLLPHLQHTHSYIACIARVGSVLELLRLLWLYILYCTFWRLNGMMDGSFALHRCATPAAAHSFCALPRTLLRA